MGKMCSRIGHVLTSEESVLRRWKEFFKDLMNEDNERERKVKELETVEQEVRKSIKDGMRKVLNRKKNRKAVD